MGNSNNLKFSPEAWAIVQKTVVEGVRPALTVIHDDEGDWLIADGVSDPNVPNSSGLYHMSHVLEVDPTIADVAPLQIGYVARRASATEPWVVEPFAYNDE